MINQAIEKIKAEMEENKNPYTEIIGNYVIQQIQVNPQVAEAIINEEKTLAESLEQMRKEALKVKQGDIAILTDEQAFKIIRDYFGFENVQQNIYSSAEPKEAKATDDDFNVSLNDFI